MTVYKVSYVVSGSDYPGAIVNRTSPPVVGEQVQIGAHTFEVVEVLNLMPPRGDFHYLHATVRLALEAERNG
ncbi:MAG: hypothetical protein L0Z70_16230 [Chloroflexi bacterium]|nr:hypothetical protein [Chloroflexota bacterium]